MEELLKIVKSVPGLIVMIASVVLFLTEGLGKAPLNKDWRDITLRSFSCSTGLLLALPVLPYDLWTNGLFGLATGASCAAIVFVARKFIFKKTGIDILDPKDPPKGGAS